VKTRSPVGGNVRAVGTLPDPAVERRCRRQSSRRSRSECRRVVRRAARASRARPRSRRSSRAAPCRCPAARAASRWRAERVGAGDADAGPARTSSCSRRRSSAAVGRARGPTCGRLEAIQAGASSSSWSSGAPSTSRGRPRLAAPGAAARPVKSVARRSRSRRAVAERAGEHRERAAARDRRTRRHRSRSAERIEDLLATMSATELANGLPSMRHEPCASRAGARVHRRRREPRDVRAGQPAAGARAQIVVRAGEPAEMPSAASTSRTPIESGVAVTVGVGETSRRGHGGRARRERRRRR
jgi:hypothetical protein